MGCRPRIPPGGYPNSDGRLLDRAGEEPFRLATAWMRILSVNTGELELLPEGNSKTKTGINKHPRKGSVHIGETHLEGDHIANKKHHGGPDQAVYLYSAEDYAWWEKELDRELPFGTFGENLTVASFDGRQPRVGDIWHFDQVVLQMTAPRIPCSKLAARMEDPAFLKHFVQVNRGGAYARVLRTLLTDLGDLVARERVASPALIIVGKVAARADALDCLGAPGVAAQIRDFT